MNKKLNNLLVKFVFISVIITVFSMAILKYALLPWYGLNYHDLRPFLVLYIFTTISFIILFYKVFFYPLDIYLIEMRRYLNNEKFKKIIYTKLDDFLILNEFYNKATTKLSNKNENTMSHKYKSLSKYLNQYKTYSKEDNGDCNFLFNSIEDNSIKGMYFLSKEINNENIYLLIDIKADDLLSLSIIKIIEIELNNLEILNKNKIKKFINNLNENIYKTSNILKTDLIVIFDDKNKNFIKIFSNGNFNLHTHNKQLQSLDIKHLKGPSLGSMANINTLIKMYKIKLDPNSIFMFFSNINFEVYDKDKNLLLMEEVKRMLHTITNNDSLSDFNYDLLSKLKMYKFNKVKHYNFNYLMFEKKN